VLGLVNSFAVDTPQKGVDMLQETKDALKAKKSGASAPATGAAPVVPNPAVGGKRVNPNAPNYSVGQPASTGGGRVDQPNVDIGAGTAQGPTPPASPGKLRMTDQVVASPTPTKAATPPAEDFTDEEVLAAYNAGNKTDKAIADYIKAQRARKPKK
jgi:hypothetical protein